MLEVFKGNALKFCYFTEGNLLFGASKSKIDHEAHGITAFSGNQHANPFLN